jgi:class 3 adenylate cyclase
MNEHDPFGDQDYRAMRGRLRALGSAPLRAGVADRVLATILFTDIVGSTEQASRLGDRRWKDGVGNRADA